MTACYHALIHSPSFLLGSTTNPQIMPRASRLVGFISGATLVSTLATLETVTELSYRTPFCSKAIILYVCPAGHSIILFLSVIVAPHFGQSCNSENGTVVTQVVSKSNKGCMKYCEKLMI